MLIVERDATIHGGQVVSRKRIPLVEKDSQQVSETDVLQYYQYNADRCAYVTTLLFINPVILHIINYIYLVMRLNSSWDVLMLGGEQ